MMAPRALLHRLLSRRPVTRCLSAAAAEHAGGATTPATPLTPGLLHCWYADHAEVVLPDGHRFPMDKYRATRLALQQDSSLTALATFTPSPLATVRDLTRVHTPDYVTRFIRGQCSAKEMRNIGFPWTESVVTRNLASVGGSLAATRALLAQPELLVTAHISGGTHHAFAHTGEGFCVFNDIAVCIAAVLEHPAALSRILVIDLDVHQGNGTAAIFADEPRVTTFDMFGDKNYPWSTRHPATHNVPLPDDVSDADYLRLLESWLPTLAALEPQFIVFQAGVDALAEDKLGRLQLSRATINARNNIVLSFALERGVPMVITMGGGYSQPTMAESVAAHADVYRTAAFRLGAWHAALQARSGASSGN